MATTFVVISPQRYYLFNCFTRLCRVTDYKGGTWTLDRWVTGFYRKDKQCLKWTARGGGGGGSLSLGDEQSLDRRPLRERPGDGVFFKFCLLKWCILVYFSYYLAQLTGLMWKG